MNDNRLGSRCCSSVCCLDIVIALLAALVLFTLGLILGVVFVNAIVEALTVLYAAGAILLLLLVIFGILKWCSCRD